MYVDADQTVYVLEYNNSRLTKWKNGATEGEIVIGKNGDGNRTDQLYLPTDMIMTKEQNTIIISDGDCSRIVRWLLENGTNGETILSDKNSGYCSLAMDKDGYLYVSDNDRHEVRRWKIGVENGTLVAGGNGKGNANNQLDTPGYLFVDSDYTLYVTDNSNHRVMKWVQNATEGVRVAGCGSSGTSLSCLSYPRGIFVDQSGTLYIADADNGRVMSWTKNTQQGSIVVGGNGMGNEPNQLHWPIYLAFDRQKNLYVADHYNSRVQKFNAEYVAN